jgi:hypothetical protein
MINVKGQLNDQLRDIEDLISSPLRYLKTLITFFLRYDKNQLGYISMGLLPIEWVEIS